MGCFTTFLRELAYFYAPRPLVEGSSEGQQTARVAGRPKQCEGLSDGDEEMRDGEDIREEGDRLHTRQEPAEEGDDEKWERWRIEHVLFPTMRRYLDAPKTLLEHDIVQVANLPDLYKVFERC